MKSKIKKELIWRLTLYLAGMIIIALGITFSAKSCLGISPMTSVPYAIAAWLEISYSKMVFLVYLVMVLAQIVLKGRPWAWQTFFQIPTSYLFTSFLGWFEAWIHLKFALLWQNLLLALAGSVLVGIGFAVMVGMQVVPNPPDGLIFVTSEKTKKDIGFWKNAYDISFVILAGGIDLLAQGKLVSIGIGTAIAMIVTGRMVALTNHLIKEKIVRLAGLPLSAG